MVERRGMAALRARLAALAIGSVLVVVVAACGSSDSSDSDATTTTKPAETTETTAATGAEGASDSGESTDDVAVKNAPLNNCTNVMSGERPTTPAAREALRQAQEQCLQRRPTTLPPRAAPTTTMPKR